MNKSLVTVFMAGFIALGSTSSFAYVIGCPDPASTGPLNGCALEGVNPGTFPYFDNVVGVSYKAKSDNSFTLTAKSYKGSVSNLLVVDDPLNPIPIDKEKYSLSAKIDPTGNVTSGNLSISGNIAGGKFTVTADLVGPVVLSPDGTLVGINTTNIVCTGLDTEIPGGCSTDESVYLNLLEPIGPQTGDSKISTAGRAITTVPVPAAAWLFGSGLLGLVAVSRRRAG